MMTTTDIEKRRDVLLEDPLKAQVRAQILDFEERLAQVPGATQGDSPECPLKHSFGGGIYMREIRIPAGTVLTGKIHRHDHPNVLVSGRVLVVTEHEGMQVLEGPMAMISRAGTKRALYAVTDTWWITFHSVGEERDLGEIERMVIVPDYKQLEAEQREALANGCPSTDGVRDLVVKQLRTEPELASLAAPREEAPCPG